MEQTKNKKNWWKYVLVFLGGAAVTAIVVMSTTGSLFTGNLAGFPSSNNTQVQTTQNDLQNQLNSLGTKLTTLNTALYNLKASYNNHVHTFFNGSVYDVTKAPSTTTSTLPSTTTGVQPLTTTGVQPLTTTGVQPLTTL